MIVELDEADVRRLVDLAARSYEPDEAEVLERALDARARAFRKAGHPLSALVLKDGHVLALAPGGYTTTKWDAVKPAVGPLLKMLADRPDALHRADTVQSYARDVFDRLGLTLRHEETLFVALVTATLMVELAANAHEREQVTDEALGTIAHVVQSFALSVLPYLPPEARP